MNLWAVIFYRHIKMCSVKDIFKITLSFVNLPKKGEVERYANLVDPNCELKEVARSSPNWTENQVSLRRDDGLKKIVARLRWQKCSNVARAFAGLSTVTEKTDCNE